MPLVTHGPRNGTRGAENLRESGTARRLEICGLHLVLVLAVVFPPSKIEWKSWFGAEFKFVEAYSESTLSGLAPVSNPHGGSLNRIKLFVSTLDPLNTVPSVSILMVTSVGSSKWHGGLESLLLKMCGQHGVLLDR